MATQTMSKSGVLLLATDEGSIDGLYDDPSGYCTFGVGHLVHVTDKWGGFLQAAAKANEAWKSKLAITLGVSNLPRTATTWADWAGLRSKAIGVGTATVGKKRFGKEPDKLTDAEKTSAKSVAEGAVGIEVDLLARIVPDVLAADLGSYERAVSAAITAVALTQDEFDALGSLTFNIGIPAFKTSSVAKKINENKYRVGSDIKLRETAIGEIEAAFALWNKSGGVVLPGLTARRNAESTRFLKGARDEVSAMKLKAASGAGAKK